MAAGRLDRDSPRQCTWPKLVCAALYQRLARRRGTKKAAVAVGHANLVIAYHLPSRDTDYIDMGADYFDRRDEHHLTRRLVGRLEALGYSVQLAPLGSAA